MRKQVIAMIATLWSCAAVASAGAEPFTYNEALSGDLSESPQQTFQFDFGVNTVSGELFLFTPRFTPATYDHDSLLFAIPSGGQLRSVEYSFGIVRRPGTTGSG